MPNITKKSGLRYYTSLMKGYFEELFNAKVDTELKTASKNPVQNSVVTTEINTMANRIAIVIRDVESVQKVLANHEQRIAAVENSVDKIQKTGVFMADDGNTDTSNAKDIKKEA